MTSTIAVIDFETTGLNPSGGDRPTEVAVVFIQNHEVVGRYQRLMNPGRPIPAFVTSLTGITDAMVRNAPSVGTVMEELHRRIGDLPLVAHNASFDRKFLDNELARIGKRRQQDFICSMRIARRLLPNAPNYKLGTLVDHIGVPVSADAHRALADAEMTAKLWIAMERFLQTRLNRREVPLSLLDHIQSVRIAGAGEYLERYFSAAQRSTQ